MVADECEFCHEGHCIGKIQLSDNFKCKYMVFTDSVLIGCNGTNDDLIEACSECQIRPANAEFPHLELCTECAAELDE